MLHGGRGGGSLFPCQGANAVRAGPSFSPGKSEAQTRAATGTGMWTASQAAGTAAPAGVGHLTGRPGQGWLVSPPVKAMGAAGLSWLCCLLPVVEFIMFLKVGLVRRESDGLAGGGESKGAPSRGPGIARAAEDPASSRKPSGVCSSPTAICNHDLAPDLHWPRQAFVAPESYRGHTSGRLATGKHAKMGRNSLATGLSG